MVKHLCGNRCTVGIDDLFKDLLKLLLSYMEIHFGKKEVFRLCSVYIAQILRQDLIKEEPSKSRLYNTCDLFTLGICLGDSYLNSGMQGTSLVLICKDCFIYTLEELAFAHCTRTLLCQIVNTQDHIL